VDLLKLEGSTVEVRFKRIKNLYLRVYPADGRVVVSAPLRMNLAQVHEFLLGKKAWIEKRLKVAARPVRDSAELEQQRRHSVAQREGLERELERLLRHWQPMMQVTVQRVTLRWMKTKWGSCTPAKGTIRINLALAERSPAALEMVLVHEMVHLLEPSHNARFYALMDRFLPEWRVAQRELEGEVK